MPSKSSKKKPVATLPHIPKEVVGQFVSGPMTAEAVLRKNSIPLDLSW